MNIKRRLARAICLLTLAAAASPVVAQPAHLLRDILTGNDSFAGEANPSALTPFGAKLAFVAVEESLGVEVWISDSESRRTYLLADICRGYCTDGPEIVGAVGSTLFFIEARSQYAERLLWASDGTPRGTHPVFDGTEVL